MIMSWHCTAALTWYDAIYCFVYGRPLIMSPAKVNLLRLYQVPDHNYLTEREQNCCGTVLWVDLVQSASASCESSSRGRAGCCIWSREGQSSNPRQSWCWFLKCRQPGQDQPHRLHLRLLYMCTWGQRTSVGALVYNTVPSCRITNVAEQMIYLLECVLWLVQRKVQCLYPPQRSPQHREQPWDSRWIGWMFLQGSSCRPR